MDNRSFFSWLPTSPKEMRCSRRTKLGQRFHRHKEITLSAYNRQPDGTGGRDVDHARVDLQTDLPWQNSTHSLLDPTLAPTDHLRANDLP
jgi:hypothetical protein